MKTRKMLTILVLALGLLVWLPKASNAEPVGTAFTYQGRLIDAENVAEGLYDFAFKLYDANSDGNKVGTDVNVADVDVIDAYFTVELDFNDANAFNGDARWLEIGVRPGEQSDPCAYSLLSPRQKVMPTPYALYALNSDGFGLPYSGSINSVIPAFEITNTEPLGFAIHGRTEGDLGSGVVGYASADIAWAVSGSAEGIWGTGVYGRASGDYGSAVFGEATGGSAIAVHGKTTSASGYAGYFEGGSNYFEGNVGIGTTSPSQKLHVISSTTGVAGWFETTKSNGNANALQAVADANNSGDNRGLYILTKNDGGGEAYSIYSPRAGTMMYHNGNVGIGTTNPGCKLHIKYGDSGQTPDHVIGLFIEDDGISNDFYAFQTATAGGGKSFSVTNAGNVGIGTTSPQEILDVNGTTRTSVLTITGGSDLSEQFDISSEGGEVKPGMVVCIDPENPSKLIVSSKAYDRRVAGIISGAGDVKPGMLMGHQGTSADGEYPVALTGRVYCLADASTGPIQPGDLLTTSYIPGHAMKVTDYTNAQGAILGKAMSSLESGWGLILVLVTLQ